MMDLFWTNLGSFFPDGMEIFPDGESAIIRDSSGNEIGIIHNDADNSFVIGRNTVHFDGMRDEFLPTILMPYVLQELDGNRRI